MKIKIIAIICALSFMVAALLTAADITMYHIPGYYHYQFESHEVLGDLNRNIWMKNVLCAFDEMMEYLRGNRDNLNRGDCRWGSAGIYNERERFIS